LNRSLYGLKQAPRAWFERLSSLLISLGFQYSKCDKSLFIKTSSGQSLFVLVYVDDILIIGSNATAVKSLIAQINSTFSLKDLGQLNYFLGIEVIKNSDGSILLSQAKYITELLEKAGMAESTPCLTPMSTAQKLSKSQGVPFSDPKFYRTIVGGLQYLAITRPDICYAVNRVCQFMASPTVNHWQAVKRLLRYLKGTSTHGLLFGKPAQLDIQAFCDAD